MGYLHMKKWCWIFAFACVAVASAAVTKSPPHGVFNVKESPPHGVFDVKEYGAVADGKTDNMQSFGFLGSMEGCMCTEGELEDGDTRRELLGWPVEFEGPCPNASPIVVQVKGPVKATIDMNKYPSNEWTVFRSIDNLMVTGGGTFRWTGPFSLASQFLS
ncbi:hypothetical protein AMTR_s00051p00052280 [Amborella trichopoda]|uniref:Uncharacterized protein n=1 Tax=Amborella trichopoda TaxID=13333 RepID=U5D2H3_AMBTC|nr:hypothetical protein AMTR_s00051p00052280 [Amborella trichopoda]